MSIQRNAPCWCGREKYKQCHLDYDRVVETYKRKGIVKTPEQIEGIRRAGIVNTKILDRVAQFIKAGISTEEINTLVHNYTIELGGTPAPLNYQDSLKVHVRQLMMLFVMEFRVRKKF